MNKKSIRLWLKSNWQLVFDVYFFLNCFIWVGWNTYKAIIENRYDFIEASFTINNIIFTILILIRRPHRAINKNYFEQAIALIAFFSGMLLIGQHETSNAVLLTTSKVIILIANILGVITLLNLGKSFGILIAYRSVKSTGLYSIVRHPMYGTDILLRIGFIISHLNIFSIVVFILSTGCYIYRALLEEKFLKQQSEYQEYMKKVKYRLIPYIF